LESDHQAQSRDAAEVSVNKMSLVIATVDPREADVTALLQRHLDFCLSTTPAEHVYALDVEKLRTPDISLFGARVDGQLVAVGALRTLDSEHGELKSMHAAQEYRGQGYGKLILEYLIAFSKEQGLKRVSLETGTPKEFLPARRMYESFGFEECPAFGEYEANPHSICMTRLL